MSLLNRARLGALTLAAIAALTACSSPDEPIPSVAGGGVEIHDAWVKTVDTGMTAVFAEITNTADSDVTIVSASSPKSSALELHETVDGVMRPRAGGFVVPAGGSLTLEPGGFHIMFMDVTEPIVAGDEVPVSLTLDNGTSVEFTAVGKDFAGANEHYDDGSMDGMDMSSPSPSASM